MVHAETAEKKGEAQRGSACGEAALKLQSLRLAQGLEIEGGCAA
ncbi:MAG: hypothetical protein U1E37_03850 [Sphingomonadaceae bacterium]